MLLHLPWAHCPDGYRLEERTAKSGGSILSGDPSGIVIVPKSRRFPYPWEPLKTPALYRQLADCPLTPEGALGFVQRHGFLFRARAKEESVSPAGILDTIRNARWLVTAIDGEKWDDIAKGLNSLAETDEMGGGLGRLGA